RDAQRALAEARLAAAVPDVLLLLEHPPVYSKGRRSTAAELPMGEDWYRAQGIEVCETDRGGRVTYHGPGQLVGYPIVSLEALAERFGLGGGRPRADVVDYVRRMESVMIEALGDSGVAARTIDGLTGVWTRGARPDTDPGPGAARKIGSIGVHVSRGITTHGLAVNVDNDLQPFEWVVPCGIEACLMTSLSRELGTRQALWAFGERLVVRYEQAYRSRATETSIDELAVRAPEAAELLGSGLGAPVA
ncbi:MAG: lipoyl(octanoyl) transferase LipB, partial [Solirubrobacterales bacterium]|nr:lipoyl(octanoyl) transferase LipB [Solirubrobacterales bacterium]